MAKTLVRKHTRTLDVRVDYPMEDDTLDSPSYTARITAPGAQRVEIRLNEGDWLSCREAVGHWWHDWSGLPSGEMTVQARAHKAGGKIVETPLRNFEVCL